MTVYVMMCSMMTFKIAATVAALLILGGSMTQPTPNNSDLNLPAAVQGVAESPALIRVGVVNEIVESDNITVKISGSPVLVTASYLFPQYQPLLGDRVYVVKQDSQWFVLGTMSGAINSAISNPSFEVGAIGATPTGWSITSVSAAGGAITFTKQLGNYLGQPISGQAVGDIQFTSNGAAAASSSNIFSPGIAASPGESWTTAFWIAGGVMSGTTLVLGSTFVQWLDSGGTLISESTAQTFAYSAGTITPAYLRPQIGTTSFTAPVGAISVRLRINVQFAMVTPAAGTISDVFLDYMVLRRVA